MKLVKRLTALFLAIVMTMAMGITAFAANDTYTITIKGDHVVDGHTYEAYQIFKGDLDVKTIGEGEQAKETATLSNVKWGDNIKADDFVKALKADNTLKDDFTDVPNYDADNDKSAAAVAEVLAKKYADDSDKLIAFSKLASTYTDGSYTYLTGTPKTSTKKGTGTEADPYYYTIDGLAVGYYLVKDKEGTLDSDDAYTRNILQVVKNVEVDAKASIPEIEKAIVENSEDVEANTQSIGGTVNYKITSKVPDMTGYDKYYFIVNDTLSKGLTYDGDETLTVKIGDTTLQKDTDYTVTSTPITKEEEVDGVKKQVATGETALKIVFKSFINHKADAGEAITITYTATVNQDAVLTDEGNPNTVKLTYSNNPNIAPKGEKDEPGEDDKDIVGETPEEKVITYVTGVKILKVDAQNTNKTLAGAKFQISGDSMKVVKVNTEMYKPVTTTEAGKDYYYMLKDGTYTTEEATEPSVDPDGTQHKGNVDKYDSTTQLYEKVTVVTKNSVKEKIQTVGYTDEKGVLTIEGLGEGEYTITELIAPDGYNKLDKDIIIEIKAVEKINSITWDVKGGMDGDTLKALERDADGNKLFKIQVKNNSGSVLPSTGGMGTTVIYVAGIAMIVAAGVVVIARKRFA